MLDPEPYLRTLKDFQLRTVEHVFRRMFIDEDCTRRFLVADEVGLGKTLVARGVIAKSIRFMQEEGKIDRIDVVYICSNASIARQNINRLNVTGREGAAMASRLTLLPIELADLTSKKINFVSFTPGTTFNLRSSTGIMRERALLYYMLADEPNPIGDEGLRRMLRCWASVDSWDYYTIRRQPERYNQRLAREFKQKVATDEALCAKLQELSSQFYECYGNPPEKLRYRRDRVIGKLREILSQVCVRVLEPDLVILDEFQRFRDLLTEETPASKLAKRLMDFRDPVAGTRARVLLLSATPYKMYTLNTETDEDHYRDFWSTLDFLYQNPNQLDHLKRDFAEYRKGLLDPEAYGTQRLIHTRDLIRNRLLKVMSRTERVPATKDRDSMIQGQEPRAIPRPGDLRDARAIQELARHLYSQSIVEYWKSSPYLLNVMKGYKIKELFEESLQSPSRDILKALDDVDDHLLKAGQIDRYKQLDPANPSLRLLMDRTIGKGLWKLLWIPPSLPYTVPAGPYEGISHATKALVFSAWNMVPDAISAVCSYEAERRMVTATEPNIGYRELSDRKSAFLSFTMRHGEPARMTSLAMTFPSPTLARLIDPLEEAVNSGAPIPYEKFLTTATARAAELVRPLRKYAGESVFPDRRWPWASLALIAKDNPETIDWITSRWKQLGTGSQRDTGEDSGFTEHVELFGEASQGILDLGSIPEDLPQTMAYLALGSPAVCALRALRRVAPTLAFDDPALMTAAAGVANAFRTMLNLPETQCLLQMTEAGDSLWEKALVYAIQGNLQATMDEYVHVLRESLGLIDHTDRETVTEISEAIQDALSIRTSLLYLDEFSRSRWTRRINKERFSVRCRFALRFSDIRDDSNAVLHRAGVVRDAFNSPFRPFILASTSIGQEGLDFHTYCHQVWHWNLPSNPVDLEQREGRVHRYKGHAIRKNVASKYGIDALSQHGDPWKVLFARAEQDREDNQNDLVPFWLFEDMESAYKVERIVPMLPFSKESGRLDSLKRALAVYRMVFGQPRQEDLIHYLRTTEDGTFRQTAEEGVSLEP